MADNNMSNESALRRNIYTINDESQHLMICGVPQLKLRQEIKKLVFPYGMVKKVHVVSNYPTEEFTEAYHIHYEDIRSARIAKHFLDGKNFYGGILHVFYVPELESVSETRAKLMQRCKDVTVRIKRNKQEFLNSQSNRLISLESSQGKEAMTPLQFPINQSYETNYQTIYNGPSINTNQQIDYTSKVPVGWRSTQNIPEPDTIAMQPTVNTNNISDAGKSAEVIKSYDKCKKRKNYKGQSIKGNMKVKIVRPHIVNTSTILKCDNKDKTISNTKKEEKDTIIIKKISNDDTNKKRIILKDSSIKQLVQPSEDLQNSIQKVKFQIRSALQNSEKIHSS
ncbi:hypothetical protein KPH14_006903 [Odynerus spinipes]|uniref:RNA-binding protein 48 n=1 Tax=Odynerus spinipes TaxID=1348599 RepID=A0AAD9RRI5_9HYME|nr:hypothetical protein KPH14_006903 [Odynerus spinipes]